MFQKQVYFVLVGNFFLVGDHHVSLFRRSQDEHDIREDPKKGHVFVQLFSHKPYLSRQGVSRETKTTFLRFQRSWGQYTISTIQNNAVWCLKISVTSVEHERTMTSNCPDSSAFTIMYTHLLSLALTSFFSTDPFLCFHATTYVYTAQYWTPTCIHLIICLKCVVLQRRRSRIIFWNI